MRPLLIGTALLLAGAAPAAAQAPICGGISLVGAWIGGAEGASDITASREVVSLEGQVPIAGHMVRMFTLSQQAEIRIDVAALPAGDPYIAVYDAAGQEVAEDDDSGGDFASQVRTTLAPGTYCLAARSYESGVTDVAVRIGTVAAFGDDVPRAPVPAPPAPDAGRGGACFEDGMALLGAAPLDAGGLRAGQSLSLTSGQTPALGFSVADSGPLSITAESEGGDPLIRLLDRNGATLFENDDHEGLNSRIDIQGGLPDGPYCLEVEDLNGEGNTIDVAVTAFDPSADRLRRLNAAEYAPTGSDPVTVTDLGPLRSALVRDVAGSSAATWLAFDLPEGGLLLAEAIGTEVDSMITLFDRAGRRVAENDDGPDGLDSFLATRLLPGRYTVAVRTVDDRSGPIRILLERYIPAP